MRGLDRFRNSKRAFVQGVNIPRPFAFPAVRHMAICGKIVDYISGHKQLDVVRRLAPLSLVNFGEILECFKERNCHSRLVEIVYENGE